MRDAAPTRRQNENSDWDRKAEGETMSGYGLYPQAMLNQQCLAAVGLAQQAVMAEQSGMLPMALMGWEQVNATLGGVVMQARQAMLPLSDQVHYGLSVAEYHTARLKFTLGRGMESPAHLGIALQAIQAALMQNPGCAPYHAFAGGLLACVGNLPGAAQELSTAVQMNPADGAAQALLSAVTAQMGMMTPTMPPVMPVQTMGGAGPMWNGMAGPGIMGGGQQAGGKTVELGQILDLTSKFLNVAQGFTKLFGD
jgi:hypothetical protein